MPAHTRLLEHMVQYTSLHKATAKAHLPEGLQCDRNDWN